MGAVIGGVIGFIVGAGVVVVLAICASDDEDPQEDDDQMAYLKKWREEHEGH